MKLGFVAAAALALFTANAANAITYVGSLSALGTTANYTITTDGRLGAVEINSFTWSGAITQGIASYAIGAALPGSFFASARPDTGLIATETEIWFDPTVVGVGFIIGNINGNISFLCLTGVGVSCGGKPDNSSITIALDNSVGNLTTVFTSTKYLVATASAVPDAVPEPSGWSMLIAGFGLTGAAMRRRKGKAIA